VTDADKAAARREWDAAKAQCAEVGLPPLIAYRIGEALVKAAVESNAGADVDAVAKSSPCPVEYLTLGLAIVTGACPPEQDILARFLILATDPDARPLA
jgi:hypothetical protein